MKGKRRSPPDRHGRPVGLLVVGHDAALGGATLSLLEILERLDRGAFEPVVVLPSPGPFVEALRERGIPCWWGPAQRWVYFRKAIGLSTALRRPWLLACHPFVCTFLSFLTMPLRMALLMALAKRHEVGLVYTNTVTTMDGALLARLIGVPHVWHLRETVAGNPHLAFPGPVSWLPRFVLDRSDRVIVNSEWLRKQLFGNATDGKVRVVHNGVDIDADPMPAGLPEQLPIPPGAKVTAICGRVHETKGVGVYLRAVAALAGAFPEVHHLIIGDGPPAYVRTLRNEVHRLGLERRVHFLGHRRDVAALLSGVDILVSASIHESFGRTLIEAMARGKPVIATRSGGPEEIVVDGESGFLVDVGDAAAIAERMSRLLANHGLAAAMASAARRRVEESFALQATVAQTAKVLSEALAAD
jgi:glycosyltransferase involved in cell wall biosynthesis